MADVFPKNRKENALQRLRRAQGDDAYWRVEDANKPDWIVKKESAENIGNFVSWLFTDIGGITSLLFILWIFKTEGRGLDLFLTAVTIYAAIGIYKIIRFIFGKHHD